MDPATPPAIDLPTELHCPLCRYSLRGLPHNPGVRCPECGHGIDWAELTRIAAEPPWLIEYARGRRFRAAIRTAWRSLRPPSFWRAVPATLAPIPRRLILYAAATLAAQIVLTLAMTAGLIEAYRWLLIQRMWAGGRNSVPLTVELFFAFVFQGSNVLMMLAVPPLWTLFNIPALLLFSQTMRRAGVSWHRVLRCVAYAATPWWAVTLYPAILIGTQGRDGPEAILLLLFIGGLWSAALLGQAYRRHLRFPAPWTTVLLAQLVTLFAIVNVLVAISQALWPY